MDLVLASINTVVLLCSSLMMALGVHAAQTDKKKALVIFLLLTIDLWYELVAGRAAEPLAPAPSLADYLAQD